MNYTDIIEAALNYCDREDDETITKIPTFVKVIESRLNRKLKLSEMSKRTITSTQVGIEYYSLPPDFAGMRDIELKSEIDSVERTTLKYVTPEMSNELSGNSNECVYTIIANQIQILPAPSDSKIMEVVYYKKLTSLNEASQNNEISSFAPDIYIFGLCAEINYFTKDKVAGEAWEARFSNAIEELNFENEQSRWSGPMLQTRIER